MSSVQTNNVITENTSIRGNIQKKAKQTANAPSFQLELSRLNKLVSEQNAVRTQLQDVVMAYEQFVQSLFADSLSATSDAGNSNWTSIGGLKDRLNSIGTGTPVPTSAPPTLSNQALIAYHQNVPLLSQPQAADSRFSAAIQQASQQFGVPENLIRGVIQQESAMNPTAVSSTGAVGLMQLMPATASQLGVTNPLDPVQNIMGGTKYLAGLLRTFNGDPTLALAAYNAGPAAVEKYNGVPPYPETQHYVQRVLGYTNQFANEV
ncbi:lytic transglycosylase domain-containing protein [Alicyclobacillus tolerans]|uniref:lytic transglycosylase domain-containing protein n=1 Tax=Alicyclobacillus tolerans TaxID=90970 RepID=UPI001F3F789C|nr:lytic transglycosylase domain-containing protein [Alicyclobacillus tolerans]MCF8568066.1 lytic transglycosylase domain-containing protein [Alicyclobacillus tolerans]